MHLIKDKKTGIYYRPYDTYDLDIIRGVYRDYDTAHLNKEDIVLDIGGHIGSFSYSIAGRVMVSHLFEPHLENYKLAKYNNKENKNVICHHNCVSTEQTIGRILYISDTNSEGTHSLHYTKRSIQEYVDSVSFSHLCDIHNPTVIKMDIEGEEHNLLKYDLPGSVHTLILEFHLSRKTWKESYKTILHNLIHIQGFIPKESTYIKQTTRTITLNLRRLNNGNTVSRSI